MADVLNSTTQSIFRTILNPVLGPVVNPIQFPEGAAGGGGFAPTDIPSLILWLDAAERGETALTWDDKSGQANHYVAGGAPQFPTFSGGEAIINNSNILEGPQYASLTQSEIFCRVNSDIASGGSYGFPFDMDRRSSADYYAYSDSHIYNGFLSTARKDCGIAITPTTVYHTLNIHSAAGDFAMRLNGAEQYSTASNTVGITALNSYVGQSSNGWYGRMKSLCMFSEKLSTENRDLMETYMAGL